jgi:Ca-activated chloride channel family protein
MTPGRTRGLSVALVATAGLVAATLNAQEVFRAGTDVVMLNVSVLDGKNRPVGGLSRDDFAVFEDNIPQEIGVFAREAQPIALSLLLDTSASMDSKMRVAQDAASGFIERLGPKDVAQVIDFDTMALIAQPFTSDHAELERAIRKTDAGGQTSLYDAVYVAFNDLRRVPKTPDTLRRQVIVLLSDGEDTSSHTEYEDVMAMSKRSDIIVFGIGLRTHDDPPQSGWNEAEWVLRTLAQETGGRVFFVKDAAQLASIYTQIADDLASQYTIGYRSKNLRQDGTWRRVVVQIRPGGAVARTKSGYFAPTKGR